MRRILTAIIALLLLGGCVVLDSHEKRPGDVAKVIWNATHSDIMRINEIFDYVSRIEQYITAEKQANGGDLSHYFPGSELRYENNILIIVTPTTYGTTYTTVVETDGRTLVEGGVWRITRGGGSHFALHLDATKGEWIEAEFDTLGYHESTGEATLRIKFLDDEYNFCYDGSITMTDTDASIEKPLHLNTVINSALHYYGGMRQITRGKLTITCHDELYDTTEIVKVDYGNEQGAANLIYHGNSYYAYY